MEACAVGDSAGRGKRSLRHLTRPLLEFTYMNSSFRSPLLRFAPEFHHVGLSENRLRVPQRPLVDSHFSAFKCIKVVYSYVHPIFAHIHVHQQHQRIQVVELQRLQQHRFQCRFLDRHRRLVHSLEITLWTGSGFMSMGCS